MSEEITFMKLKVEKETCIGCGMCTGICPSCFTFDDDSKAEVTCPEIPADLEESAEEAKNSCPVQAIVDAE